VFGRSLSLAFHRPLCILHGLLVTHPKLYKRTCLVFAKFRLEAEASLCSARVERIGKVVEPFRQGHIEIASQAELCFMGQDILPYIVGAQGKA
jgi:hypothetical protein